MALLFVREARARSDWEALRATGRAIREAATHREVWIVAGFIFFFNFSPSFGPAFLYYQTDVLRFSQEFIGVLGSLTSVGAVLGALIYAPLSRRYPLRRIIVWAIGVGVASMLAYLGYRGPTSALIIDFVTGVTAMVTQLAFLDLAAKACPPRVEGTFFALLMSVFNGGTQLSQNVGGPALRLVGYTPLIFISAGMTALAWLLVPLVNIDRIEAEARAARAAEPRALRASGARTAPGCLVSRSRGLGGRRLPQCLVLSGRARRAARGRRRGRGATSGAHGPRPERSRSPARSSPAGRSAGAGARPRGPGPGPAGREAAAPTDRAREAAAESRRRAVPARSIPSARTWG